MKRIGDYTFFILIKVSLDLIYITLSEYFVRIIYYIILFIYEVFIMGKVKDAYILVDECSLYNKYISLEKALELGDSDKLNNKLREYIMYLDDYSFEES